MEVFYRGQWGTICDHSWSFNDATVACRQLGYDYAVRTLRGGQVPPGSGPIWLSFVGCSGREQNLTRCSHGGWGNHDSYCNHTNDAGVECSSTGKIKYVAAFYISTVKKRRISIEKLYRPASTFQ